MQSTDWFNALNTNFKPMDLLLDPEFIEDRVISKKRELESLQTEYQKLSATPRGNIDDLKKAVHFQR